jgi:MerR family transcriptional regulator, mercuric resistance operon regulatory protein
MDERMEHLTIGKLAAAAGVGVETVRYYQRRGLLPEPRRPQGSVRRYGGGEVARLAFIRRAQEVGFTLDEVKDLIRIGESPNCRGAREIAARKLEVVRMRLRDLAQVRDALAELIGQCDAGKDRRCPIIENLAKPRG